MSEAYDVPAEGLHRVEQTIKKSKFIVSMVRAADEDTAQAFFKRIKEEFPGANHNCRAFNCGRPGDRARVGRSDDGEPSGTAGNPMLEALLRSDVGEVACTVTRFFGGIKLGTGGLVRAYGDMVRLGLESLPRKRLEEQAEITVRTGHDTAHTALHQGRVHGAELTDGTYGEQAVLTFRLPASKADPFVRDLTDATRGGEVHVTLLPLSD